MKQFKRPLLAASLLPSDTESTNEQIMEALRKLHYPKIASWKEDGIRATKWTAGLASRTMLRIPNRSIQERAKLIPNGHDMELGNRAVPYNKIESIVMSEEHKDSDLINFLLLDIYMDGPYHKRLEAMESYMMDWCRTPKTYIVDYKWCINPQELMDYFLYVESLEGEGICIRRPDGLYIQKDTKDNRSTLDEETLLKLTRWKNSECIVEGFIEQTENTNGIKYNAIGRMNRSKCKDLMIPKNTLGTLLVRDIHTNVQFEISTGIGLNFTLRKEIWMNKPKYMSTVWMYKYKGGGKNKPRSPILKGQRKEIDI